MTTRSIYLFVFYLFISIQSSGQSIEFPLINKRITYTDTVFVNNTSKDTLYVRAKQWILKNFPTQNTPLNASNKTDSLIHAKGTLDFNMMDLNNLNRIVYDYNIYVKIYDNAYIYKIEDFKGKLYEKSQYTSNSAAKVSIDEDYAAYLKNKRNTEFTRRVKYFYKIISKQLNSFNTSMSLENAGEYPRGPHLE
ncbi:DUF4468 domain-containing protein [Solitalea lacus]|uniref:DUF4468 domain-containing protein n=1 Tax=Solitalea lacus TaxID=2911172 RepID=UPI001ED9E55E|nr:DUF4468 domain-containing protein [Solitalea lacus]UKJ09029.1 DUF4468 domain-containing protein [Solitalea lacus]